MTIAALYIDPLGPYPRMARGETFRVLGPHGEPYCREWGPPRELDCWDESRDARLYAGPHPVVAHPPCRNWSRLRHLAKGDDSDCALRAVEQVRAFGGVLEHPAGSRLWLHADLPMPLDRDWVNMRARVSYVTPCDRHGGYTAVIDQVEWGHVARKRTWLYLVGVPCTALEAPPFPGREPTHAVTGGRHYPGRKHRGYTGSLKCCSAQQRRRTPQLFAEYLIRLARAAGEARRAA